jgi:hypothetical protein
MVIADLTLSGVPRSFVVLWGSRAGDLLGISGDGATDKGVSRSRGSRRGAAGVAAAAEVAPELGACGRWNAKADTARSG